MRYPFHLGENLTALARARDFEAVVHLTGRNFDLVMNAQSQSQTLRKLRVVQLQATVTRAIYRAGADPHRLFECEMVYLEKISRIRADDRAGLRSLMLAFTRDAIALIPQHPSAHPNLVQRFLREVEQGALPVSEVARRLGVTAAYLSRVVKQTTGRSPRQHILHHRLGRARDVLAKGSVADAAREAGFAKVSAFIAQFRRCYGDTPGAYRRGLRA
jgi:AraC-like DNA-binding protein